jgi:hypothetical protein
MFKKRFLFGLLPLDDAVEAGADTDSTLKCSRLFSTQVETLVQ